MGAIKDVINVLRSADRIGPSEDKPEGVRYIQISDTLATQLADRLEKENSVLFDLLIAVVVAWLLAPHIIKHLKKHK